jgi:hypothetical protein
VTAVGFGPVDTRLTRAVPKAALANINAAIGRPEGTTMEQAVEFLLAHLRSAKAGSIEYLGQIP